MVSYNDNWNLMKSGYQLKTESMMGLSAMIKNDFENKCALLNTVCLNAKIKEHRKCGDFLLFEVLRLGTKAFLPHLHFLNEILKFFVSRQSAKNLLKPRKK